MNSPNWHRQAACRGMDPELFFPRPGSRASEAKEVCAGCPVKAECLEAGMDEHFGVWGGMTRGDRQLASKGYRSNRVPARGCWLCGMPVERPARYCSDECRARARRESQLPRANQGRGVMNGSCE